MSKIKVSEMYHPLYLINMMTDTNLIQPTSHDSQGFFWGVMRTVCV